MSLNFKQENKTATNWFKNDNAISEKLTTYTNTEKRINYLWVAKGDTRRIVILDVKPIVKLHFHIDAGAKYEKVPCISEHDSCPICEVAGQGSRFGKQKGYIIVTVLDLTPWTTKDGKEMKYTKKIWAIETEAQRNIVAKYLEKYGTTRGLVLDLTRSGAKGEGSSGSAMYEDFISEQQIKDNFTNPEYKNDEGKVLKPAGEDTRVFDYGKLFTLPTANDLRRKYNLSAPFGSKEDNKDFASAKASNESYVDSEVDPSDYDSLDDDIPF